MWLLINNILKKYEIAYHNYAEAKRASNAKIIFSNLHIRSKQPRTIKTVIHNDILTYIRRKKVQSPAKQFKDCSVCVRITFDGMESSFARFNYACF